MVYSKNYNKSLIKILSASSLPVLYDTSNSTVEHIAEFISKDYNITFYENKILETLIHDYAPSLMNDDLSNLILINDRDFVNVIENATIIVDNYAKATNKTIIEAMMDIKRYYELNNIGILPSGINGYINKFCNTGLVSGSTGYLTSVLSHCRTVGESGISVCGKYPFTLIAVPTVFGIGFSALELIGKGTCIEPSCHVLTRICFSPLYLCEITINVFVFSLPNIVLQKFDLQFHVNATKTITNGYALDLKLVNDLTRQASNALPKSFNKRLLTFVSKFRGGG